jgi:hypothetical protein
MAGQRRLHLHSCSSCAGLEVASGVHFARYEYCFSVALTESQVSNPYHIRPLNNSCYCPKLFKAQVAQTLITIVAGFQVVEDLLTIFR